MTPFQQAKSPSKKDRKKAALFSFSEARRMARYHGFSSKEEFLEYDCPGAYQLPKNPQNVWPTDWTSWEDFLGISFSFEEAVEATAKLRFKSPDEYMTFVVRESARPEAPVAGRLPHRPDLYYKAEWKSWDDYLGV